MTKNIEKKRGIFLTILLIYGALEAVLVFFSGIIYPIIGLLGSNAGKLTLLVSALEFIPLAAALYGMWKWKKWGIYSLIAYIAISILSTVVFDVVLKLYTGYAQYVILFDIIIAALWFWALYRKRAYFIQA